MLLPALAMLLAAAGPQVAAPPTSLAADPFYTRYLDADGIPILASSRTPPQALAVAREIVNGMLAKRPDIRRELIRQGERVVVMAASEGTLDVPEQRGWKKPTRDDARLTRCERKHYDVRIGARSDRDYWNARARGMGGMPLTSAAAENLLAANGDRYHGQNIFVHEFAHVILLAAEVADPSLHARVKAAYADAVAAGRWSGEYASTTFDEYWAVGTQFWFESGPLVAFDTVRILSPEDLRAYDPALFALLGEVYGDHRLEGDAFWRHPDRVPPGPLPKFTAEVC